MSNGSGDDSSQETFDLGGGSRRRRLTGSLEHLVSRTPPHSLRIRTFSIEEQQEQEAASGTRDKRVGGEGEGGGGEGGEEEGGRGQESGTMDKMGGRL